MFSMIHVHVAMFPVRLRNVLHNNMSVVMKSARVVCCSSFFSVYTIRGISVNTSLSVPPSLPLSPLQSLPSIKRLVRNSIKKVPWLP